MDYLEHHLQPDGVSAMVKAVPFKFINHLSHYLQGVGPSLQILLLIVLIPIYQYYVSYREPKNRQHILELDIHRLGRHKILFHICMNTSFSFKKLKCCLPFYILNQFVEI